MSDLSKKSYIIAAERARLKCASAAVALICAVDEIYLLQFISKLLQRTALWLCSVCDTHLLLFAFDVRSNLYLAGNLLICPDDKKTSLNELSVITL